jgi:hydrogenase expression/formation protein HypC
MCLAIPARITSIDVATDTAKVALGAVSKEISLALIEDAAVGDYVLIHVGYALNKISEEEAQRTLEIIAEMGLLEETEVSLDAEPRIRRKHRGDPGEASMKYIDEFRDQRLARRLAETIAAEAHPGRDSIADGVLRRPYPRDLPLRRAAPDAAESALHPRPRLSGLRAADGPHRPCDRARHRSTRSRSAPTAT